MGTNTNNDATSFSCNSFTNSTATMNAVYRKDTRRENHPHHRETGQEIYKQVHWGIYMNRQKKCQKAYWKRRKFRRSQKPSQSPKLPISLLPATIKCLLILLFCSSQMTCASWGEVSYYKRICWLSTTQTRKLLFLPLYPLVQRLLLLPWHPFLQRSAPMVSQFSLLMCQKANPMQREWSLWSYVSKLNQLTVWPAMCQICVKTRTGLHSRSEGNGKQRRAFASWPRWAMRLAQL